MRHAKKSRFRFGFDVYLTTGKKGNEMKSLFRSIVEDYGLKEDDGYVGEPKIIYKLLKNGGK